MKISIDDIAACYEDQEAYAALQLPIRRSHAVLLWSLCVVATDHYGPFLDPQTLAAWKRRRHHWAMKAGKLPVSHV